MPTLWLPQQRATVTFLAGRCGNCSSRPPEAAEANSFPISLPLLLSSIPSAVFSLSSCSLEKIGLPQPLNSVPPCILLSHFPFSFLPTCWFFVSYSRGVATLKNLLQSDFVLMMNRCRCHRGYWWPTPPLTRLLLTLWLPRSILFLPLTPLLKPSLPWLSSLGSTGKLRSPSWLSGQPSGGSSALWTHLAASANTQETFGVCYHGDNGVFPVAPALDFLMQPALFLDCRGAARRFLKLILSK